MNTGDLSLGLLSESSRSWGQGGREDPLQAPLCSAGHLHLLTEGGCEGKACKQPPTEERDPDGTHTCTWV